MFIEQLPAFNLSPWSLLMSNLVFLDTDIREFQAFQIVVHSSQRSIDKTFDFRDVQLTQFLLYERNSNVLYIVWRFSENFTSPLGADIQRFSTWPVGSTNKYGKEKWKLTAAKYNIQNLHTSAWKSVICLEFDAKLVLWVFFSILVTL